VLFDLIQPQTNRARHLVEMRECLFSQRS
jgi:hypothetical protein